MAVEFDFEYVGGLHKQSYKVAKFLIFLVASGEEVPFYRALKFGMLRKTGDKGCFSTEFPAVKVFLKLDNFGMMSKYLSFYFMLGRPEPRRVYTIRPFEFWPDHYYFKAEGRFLKKQEVLGPILTAGSVSYKIFEKQKYPRAVVEQLVSVEKDRPKEMETVRRVRI